MLFRSYLYYIPQKSSDSVKLVCDITEYNNADYDAEDIKVYVNDMLIGSIDKAGKTELKIGHVDGGELLTVKFKSDNMTYILYSISLDEE